MEAYLLRQKIKNDTLTNLVIQLNINDIQNINFFNS